MAIVNREVPPLELSWIEPLDGIRTMLELGNKKTKSAPAPYKRYFERRGIQHTSVDINGEDGALPLDLRKPLNLGTFDMVTNIGTTEHVSIQEPVWRNIAEACDRVLVSCCPAPGHWRSHGMFYPHSQFYVEFARLNGFILERLETVTKSKAKDQVLIFARMHRFERRDFAMPPPALIFKNADTDQFGIS